METIDKLKLVGSIFIIGYGISVIVTRDGVFRGMSVEGNNSILLGLFAIAFGSFGIFQLLKKRKQK